MSNYWIKLKDPRWQKLRLEAMQNADFHCESCGDGKSTLNVHHKQYFKGREPWEYESKQLVTLCESCHEEQHESENELRVISSYANFDGPSNQYSAASLLGGFIGLTEYSSKNDEGTSDARGISPWHWMIGNVIANLERYSWTSKEIKFNDEYAFNLMKLANENCDELVLHLIDFVNKNTKDNNA